jgi:ubiquinone/menaquinone biosynthesis C-methylase UbiE
VSRRALLLWAFQLLYQQFAWAYEAVSAAVSLGQWRDWGAAALPFLSGPRILELGHGPGHLLAAAEGDFWPVGLDLSPQMGGIARRRLARYGLPARLVRGRGQALPFAPATFDGLVAAFPAPYILAPETLAAMWRVLRPGGRLVIVPEAELTGSGWPARLIEQLYVITGQRGASGQGDVGGDTIWRRALMGPGFVVVTEHRVELPGSVVTVIVAERA